MEISVNTRLKGDEFKVDISINGMDAMKLPSFSTDKIREMVKPQVKMLLLMNGGVKSENVAEEMANAICYGTPLPQSTSEEDDETSGQNPPRHQVL